MTEQTELTPGTLRLGEYHPAAESAFRYIKKYLLNDLNDGFSLRESFASCGLDGNRLAEICSETLERIMTSQPVSDRYLLGLAWTINEMERTKNDRKETDAF